MRKVRDAKAEVAVEAACRRPNTITTTRPRFHSINYLLMIAFFCKRRARRSLARACQVVMRIEVMAKGEN